MIGATTSKPSIKEFIKFLITGGSNTLVDFTVLNILIVVLGLAHGDHKYMYFKAISFLAASVNSFILNKWWVFRSHSPSSTTTPWEVGTFITVGGIGLVLNTLISFLVFHVTAAIFPEFSAHLLANIGAVSGTLLVLLFNFSAYKYIVFKK